MFNESKPLTIMSWHPSWHFG